MAFNINPGKQQFSATAAQTVFTFNFAIFAGTDLKVYKTLAGAVANDTTDLLTLSTHYTVSINGTLGGTVTLLSGASLNDTITLVRSLPIARTTDYVTNGDLYAEILDLDQDYQTYLTLDQKQKWERSVVLPDTYSGSQIDFPVPSQYKFIRWNLAENGFENVDPSTVLSSSDAAIIANVTDFLSIDTSVYTTTIVKDIDRGGTFIWSSTGVANGGTVFAGATGYWNRQYSGAVNVKWFGAKGDGISDDTAAIQSSINSLNNVFLPEGTYKITSTIQLISGVSLYGLDRRPLASSESKSKIYYYGTGVAIKAYSFNTPYLNGYSNIEIANIYINDVNGTGTIGLDLQGFRSCKVSNVAIRGFNQGLHTFQSWFSVFDNLEFSTYRQYSIYAEGLDNNTTWRHIRVGAAGVGATTPVALFYGATTIEIDSLDAETVGGIKFDNCTSLTLKNFYFETTALSLSYALLLAACVGSNIISPYIDGNSVTTNGINNGALSEGTTISGGKIIACTKPIEDSSFGKECNTVGIVTDVPIVFGGSRFGARKIGWTRWTAAPTAPTGAWNAGDIVFNDSPTLGTPTGWVCAVAGTPGTWYPFAKTKLTGSATFDPVSLASGVGTTASVSVTGAVLGDFAIVSFSNALQNITLTAYVSASNIVEARFHNGSGATVDLASGTIKVIVEKQ